MKSKDEIKKWLIENAVDVFGELSLSDIDFGDISLNFRDIKATMIFNNRQIANYISNNYQQARSISNENQYANAIHNGNQKIKPNTIYQNMTKEELIKELEKRDREWELDYTLKYQM